MSKARSIRAMAGLAVAILAVTGLAACDGPSVAVGRVTVDGTGAHPAGVAVTAYADDAETVVAEVLTDAAGNYRFGDQALPAGTYRLRFNHDEWWGGTSWATATPVDVSTTAPATVSPTLAYRTATITGTVNGGMSAVALTAANVAGGPVAVRQLGWTDEDPTTPGFQYTVSDLPAGTYRIRFSTTSVNDRNAAFVFSGSAYTASTAPTHELAPGSVVGDVDTTFPTGSGFAFAAVTDGTPVDIAYGIIGSRHLVLSADTLEPVSEVVLQMNGTYRAIGIPPIPFRILLVDPSGRLRPTFVGETAAAPQGTAFTNGADVPRNLKMIGRDCTRGDYYPGADLSGRDLVGKQLAGCFFSATDLSGFDLHTTKLTGADFTDANLTGANLANAQLAGADLRGADLTGANLTDANLTGADLRGADLTDATMTRTTLWRADLRGADLLDVTLGGAEFLEADLSGTDLHGVDLSGASLSQTRLTGTDLTGATLDGASLYRADATGAILSGASLVGTNGLYAKLIDADLTNADLTNARLEGADLSGADLTGATSTGVQAAGTIHANTTCPTGSVVTSPASCFP